MNRFWLISIAAALAQVSPVHAQGGPAHAQTEIEAAVEAEVPAADGALHAIEPMAMPVEVERIVRFRALGFGQDEPFGGSIEVAALLDSNINRATRADTLGTVISDVVPPQFVVPGNGVTVDVPSGSGGVVLPPVAQPGYDDDARSALGVSLRGQSWLRRQLNNDADLLVRASGSGQIYGDGRYTDLAFSLQGGPEYAVGSDRIAVFVGPAWRWYGSQPYSLALGGGVSWQHPIGRYGQLRVELGAAHLDNRRDDQLDGASYTLTAEFDRALSARSGMGAQLLFVRETARDPGFATTSGALTLHAFQEFGTTTIVTTFGYSRLEADQRLPYFERRRVDDRFAASLTATFQSLRLGPLAPLARLNWERNRSTVSYYDFRRVAGELGLVAAF